MDEVETIESTLASVFKSRGFRKRGRNWFRATSAEQYQVVNLQKSSWGGGNCYLNLGWDPVVPDNGFRPEHQCSLSIRAEEADVIPSILKIRPDGITTTELPGIALLDSETYSGMPTDQLVEEVAEVIGLPVADLMDSTPSVLDLVPLLTSKPWLATRSLREYLKSHGCELPTSW